MAVFVADQVPLQEVSRRDDQIHADPSELDPGRFRGHRRMPWARLPFAELAGTPNHPILPGRARPAHRTPPATADARHRDRCQSALDDEGGSADDPPGKGASAPRPLHRPDQRHRDQGRVPRLRPPEPWPVRRSTTRGAPAPVTAGKPRRRRRSRTRTRPAQATFQKEKPRLCGAFAMRRRGLEPPPGYPGPGPQPGASTNSAIGARATASIAPQRRG